MLPPIKIDLSVTPSAKELKEINKQLAASRNLLVAAQRTAAMATAPKRQRTKVLPGDPITSQVLYLRHTHCKCGSNHTSSRGLFDRRGPGLGLKMEKLDTPTSLRDNSIRLETIHVDQSVSHCQDCLTPTTS